MKQVVLRYSEPLLREAVRAFFLRAVYRQLGARFFVVLALIVGAVAFLLLQYDRSVLLGFLLATLGFVAVFLGSIYVGHYRNTIGRFRKMKSAQATLIYDEQQLTLTSELGSSTLPWSVVAEVWQFRRFWLLLLSPAQFVTLPLDCLDAATQEFILRKVKRA